MNTEKSRNMVGGPLAVTERDHIEGSINAPITLIEYGDYQCSHCGRAHLIVKEIQALLGERLCFVFRHFPLTQVHPFAAHAAEAAEAAGAEWRFWEMHDMLFLNQHDLTDGALKKYAHSLGLDAGRVSRELGQGVHAARVREDFSTGIRVGVNGTPSFFINGIRYDGAVEVGDLVDALLKAAPVR